MPKRGIEKPGLPEAGPRLRRHVADLGFKSFAHYADWCRANGFSASGRKSAYDLDVEAQHFAREKTRKAELSRLDRNPVKLIEAACRGALAAKDILRPALRAFCEAIEKSDSNGQARASLCRLLLHTHANAKAGLLFEKQVFQGRSFPYINALIALNERRSQWIAPVETWRPSSHNMAKQFSSLIRHLTARYTVPGFLDQAWFITGPGSNRYRDWFLHIGSGKNIRTAQTPIPLTKLMAHHFLQAPPDISIEGAFRWGQVHALGGDARLVEAILGTRLGNTFEHDDFWVSVIRFFIENPLLDRQHVAPIADYLYEQRFVAQEVFTAPGVAELRPPPQPNLCMRGRTAASLLAQVERWHRQLGRAEAPEALHFKTSGIRPFERRSGPDGATVWRIRELLSGAELVAEGRAMRHCVATYARSCARGACSIWTLEYRSPTTVGTEKRQTIEVSRNNSAIVQCRGRANRLPTASEFAIVQAWAREAGLTIPPYVRSAGE